MTPSMEADIGRFGFRRVFPARYTVNPENQPYKRWIYESSEFGLMIVLDVKGWQVNKICLIDRRLKDKTLWFGSLLDLRRAILALCYTPGGQFDFRTMLGPKR